MADTQKKKRSVYSFGLKKTDSPIIKEFIENQTNFSETVRYLIYKYVSENNTDDISYKFNELLFNNAISLKANNSENINTSSSNTNVTHNVTNTNSEIIPSINEVNYSNEISCDDDSLVTEDPLAGRTPPRHAHGGFRRFRFPEISHRLPCSTRPVVYVAADGTAARKAADNVAALSGKRTAVLAAKDEVLLYRKGAVQRIPFSAVCNGIRRPAGAAVPCVAARGCDALVQLFPANGCPCMDIEGGGGRAIFSSLPARPGAKWATCAASRWRRKGAFARPRATFSTSFPSTRTIPSAWTFSGIPVEQHQAVRRRHGRAAGPARGRASPCSRRRTCSR